MYLYADSNGIPGLDLGLIISLVMAFVLLGKIMEITGATGFFTDLSMAWLPTSMLFRPPSQDS